MYSDLVCILIVKKLKTKTSSIETVKRYEPRIFKSTHFSSFGEMKIMVSLKSLSTAPNKNCPPNARQSAGRIDAGFFSLSGLKFTLAEVLL